MSRNHRVHIRKALYKMVIESTVKKNATAVIPSTDKKHLEAGEVAQG